MSKPSAPSLIGNPKPAKAAAPAAPAKTGPLRWFLVESPDKVIRLPSRAEFVIRQGKEINSAEYDVGLLQARGVKLKEIDTPNWWNEAQAKGIDRHAELAAKGIILPDPPEHVASTPLPS